MLKAHTSHGVTDTLRSGLHFGLTILPTAATAALPKCPVCLMGVLSAIGLGSVIKASWLLPLSLTFLIIAIGLLLHRSRKRHDFKPLLTGALAAGLILVGKFYFDSYVLTYLGVGILIATSIWSSWPKRSSTPCRC